jgi:tetratricopeptide (TPR) repeat protein
MMPERSQCHSSAWTTGSPTVLDGASSWMIGAFVPVRDFEAAIAAVETRLRAIKASGDLSMASGSEADRELRRLRRARGRDPELRAAFAIGWLFWYRHLALPDGQIGEDGRRAYAELMPCVLRGLEPIPDGLLPDIAIGALPRAATMLNKAMTAHDSEAIMAAVTTWRRLIAAIPETAGAWPAAMVMLCVALQGSFECTGNIEDLDQAIDSGRRGLESVQPDHPELGMMLCNVAAAMRMRSNNSGGAGGRYADEAVALYRRAVVAIRDGRRERPGALSSLAATLRARFEASRAEADLDESIVFARQAVSTARTLDPQRYQYLVNLAASLRARHAVTGALDDLSEAIRLLRAALARTPARHPDHAANCANLAAALWTRYEESGAEQVLDQVIGLLRQAAAAVHGGDPARAQLLSNLSVAVCARFKLARATADLDAAVDIARQAVSAAPPGNDNLARYQSNLCSFLRLQGNAASAIDAGLSAVAGTAPGDPELARRLSNLANAQRDVGDLDAAIGTLRRADSAASADSLRDPLIRSNLGLALEAAGQGGEATRVLRSALHDAPAGHPGRPVVLANLASVLRQSGSREDRAEAMALFAEAAGTESAAPSLRARAARAACLAADMSSGTETSRAALLLEMAVGLLPSIVPRRLYRGDQQRYLAEFSGLASDAAALVLAEGGPGSAQRALRLLEAGRGVLLSQVLDTRTDLTLLRLRHPKLAARYTRLRDQLDSDPGDGLAALSSGSHGAGFGSMALSLERQAGERQRMAASFAATVAEIRALADFSGFMLPPGLDDLMAQAQEGPIAVLNVSSYRSDALLLTPSGIRSVPLPGLTPEAVRARVLSLQPTRVRAELPAVLDWLWDTVAGPVLDALDLRRSAPSAPLPRMWWVPGGLLSLLPIHAAGQAIDRVISSYAPTVRALAHARASPASTAPVRSLIVAMPSSPAPYGNLPGASVEAASLRLVLPRPTVLTEPTAAQVLLRLRECAIVHFACHGITDSDNPSRSGLILTDEPLTVSALSPVRLPAGQLAYMSACRTAVTGAEGLADESIHITSAFQLAGFPHVIGTLWPIGDRQGCVLAAEFHTTLRATAGSFNPAHAAHVLNDITQQIRAKHPDVPALWASHIHVGA